ncbi:unnamed protein product [Polarella glacialis]|uniref:CID domain-containing protein n=1 Tax=Polarella glacialis TaxID=89957 RepID=A0A813I8P5_POLGL|nr:unnamed protein product [Polarella glacialis]
MAASYLKSFDEDLTSNDLVFARNKKEFRDFEAFDSALRSAQSAQKDELSKNVNAAAKVALRLVSTTGMKHVIRRLCLVSKDPHAHKETAIYTVDSILRHAAVDEELRVKYEKHFQLHLRNLFKRALQMDSTRVSLAEKFFGKILTKWKAKKWFDNELEAIVQVVHNSAPNVPKPATLQPQYLSGRRSSAGSDASGMGDIGMDLDLGGLDSGGMTPVPFPQRPGPGGLGSGWNLGRAGATAKAGAPATPAQPHYLYPGAPATPRGAFKEHLYSVPATPKLESVHSVMMSVPATPRSVLMSVPATPMAAFGGHSVLMSVPSTPMPGGMRAPQTPMMGAPMTPMPSRVPQTPMQGMRVPSTPAHLLAAPGTPGMNVLMSVPGTPFPNMPGTPGRIPSTPGGTRIPSTPGAGGERMPSTPGGQMQPFTPSRPAAQPFTPGGAAQPFTPGGAAQPFTPGGLAAQPFTPGGLQPVTPAPGRAQPFTPAGPQPFTPAGLQPPTPAGPQPFTPAGMQPPTPAGPQPFTPAGMQPPTPAGPQPFTPASPAKFAAGTPAGPQPFTPASPAMAMFAAGTPSGVQPFTPASPAMIAAGTPASPASGTPAFQPFTPAGPASSTPAMQPFTPFSPNIGTPASGTPGYVPIAGGDQAPLTPFPGHRPPATPSFQPGTPGFQPNTPGFLPIAGGEVAPLTPAFPGAFVAPKGQSEQPAQPAAPTWQEPEQPVPSAEPPTATEPTATEPTEGEPTVPGPEDGRRSPYSEEQPTKTAHDFSHDRDEAPTDVSSAPTESKRRRLTVIFGDGDQRGGDATEPGQPPPSSEA